MSTARASMGMSSMPYDSSVLRSTGGGLLGSNKSKIAVSAICGAILGALVSLTVNCTLVEISINAFFSLYFGVLFVVIGAVILYRIYVSGHPQSRVLVAFAILIFISGFLCFFLERDWFHTFSPGAKVPLYAVLGVAVCFALLFSIVDLLNYLFIVWQSATTPRPLVEKGSQVIVLVTTATVMGFTFGLIFGLMDVEDANMHHLRLALAKEQMYCYPLGALFGGLCGAINQYLRNKDSNYRFDPLSSRDPFGRHF